MENQEPKHQLTSQEALDMLIEMFAKRYRGGAESAREDPEQFLTFLFLAARDDPNSPFKTSELLQWANPDLYTTLWNQ